MNKTIFQIDDDFLSVYNALEENGGELTPELEEQLAISKEELTNKVKNYCKLITATKADIAAIKEEQDRLKSLQKSKENTVKGISHLVIYALKNYGTEDKKGKISIDWGTGRVSIRNSQSVEVDTDKVDEMAKTLKQTFASLAYANVLDTGDEIDLESIIDTLEHNEDSIDGTPDPIEVDNNDFDNVTATVSFDVPMSELIKGQGYQAMSAMLKIGTHNWNIKGSVDKKSMKENIINGQSSNVACIANNESLNIK